MPIHVNTTTRKIEFNYPCSSTSDCFPYEISIKQGYYYLEVWGAQGGNATNQHQLTQGGSGGYSSGVFVSKALQNLYLHIGGTDNSTNSYGPCYNGGGKGLNGNDGCGGGATDFRTSPGKWNESFESRIIIAGGGGGSYAFGGLSYAGGQGGGLKGGHDSSDKSSIGTQLGCENKTSYSTCGEVGIGASGWYGSGGGGKYGGGHYFTGDPDGDGSGGGGGSGSIDGVISYGKWKSVCEFSDHKGLGYASITFIGNFIIPVSCYSDSFRFRYILISSIVEILINV